MYSCIYSCIYHHVIHPLRIDRLGCENYANGVARLFGSDCKAEIISIVGSDDDSNKIVITWRLSGSVNFGKFFIVFSFTITVQLPC